MIPAATVVVVRDGAAGLEMLLLHRHDRGAFGGHWVFPGGQVEPGDSRGDGDEPAARRAAVRETAEECGLGLDPGELVPLSYWVPPPHVPKRFGTWFYVARADGAEVVVDGVEMQGHVWERPAAALARFAAGEVVLAPPTWVTLHDLAELDDVAGALAWAAGRVPVPRYEARWVRLDGVDVALWDGDAAYASGDLEAPGPRHRLWMVPGGWRLERDL